MSEFSKNAVECVHTCVWPSVDHSGVVGAASWCLGKQTPCFFPLTDCVTRRLLRVLRFLLCCSRHFPVVETSDSSALHVLSSIASAADPQDGPACCNCFLSDAVSVAQRRVAFFSFDELDNVGEMHPPIFFILHSLILFPTPSIFCMRISKALYHCRQICG